MYLCIAYWNAKGLLGFCEFYFALFRFALLCFALLCHSVLSLSIHVLISFSHLSASILSASLISWLHLVLYPSCLAFLPIRLPPVLHASLLSCILWVHTYLLSCVHPSCIHPVLLPSSPASLPTCFASLCDSVMHASCPAAVLQTMQSHCHFLGRFHKSKVKPAPAPGIKGWLQAASAPDTHTTVYFQYYLSFPFHYSKITISIERQ